MGFDLFGKIADWLTFACMRLSPASALGAAVRFFIFEAPKILMLLVLVVFIVGIVRSFFTKELARRRLIGRKALFGNVVAALLGVITPFCSCSAVPLFVGFVTAGVPLGVTLSFLIASPLINEVALVMLFGLFGWKVAAAYMGMGLFIAIASGWLLGRLRPETWVEPWVFAEVATAALNEEKQFTWENRINSGFRAVRTIVGRVWPYVLVGIAMGAIVHGYVPEHRLETILGRSAWWSVPLAVCLGVPLYSTPAGVIPILQALLEKGVALGTALAFMMAVIGLSLPEAVILRKVMKPRLLVLFFGVVATGIAATGYFFNAFF
jgi:uncharacterized protein